jgi:hypothetical protein
MTEPKFYPERLAYKGVGIYVYTEDRDTIATSRKAMAVKASEHVGEPLTLLYRNCPDSMIRNYVLQETERYEKLQKKSKS